MLQSKTLSARLTILLDRTLLQRTLSGQKLLLEDQQNNTQALETLLTSILKFKYIITQIKKVLDLQKSLTLSGKAFYLSNDHVPIKAFIKDYNRSQELIQSSINPTHVKILEKIIKQLKKLIEEINKLEFVENSLSEMKKKRNQNILALSKLLKKRTTPLYRAIP
jgi:hypothetical protein